MMLVKWTLYAMINAEELGITSKNVDEALKSKKPDVMRLVGTEGSYGEDLGLTKDWAVRIIRHVGNYGEIYDRNVGDGSKLKIPRGLNSLWSTAASSTRRRSGRHFASHTHCCRRPLDRAIQYSRDVDDGTRGRGVLDHPPSRVMTRVVRCFARPE